MAVLGCFHVQPLIPVYPEVGGQQIVQQQIHQWFCTVSTAAPGSQHCCGPPETPADETQMFSFLDGAQSKASLVHQSLTQVSQIVLRLSQLVQAP